MIVAYTPVHNSIKYVNSTVLQSLRAFRVEYVTTTYIVQTDNVHTLGFVLLGHLYRTLFRYSLQSHSDQNASCKYTLDTLFQVYINPVLEQ